MFPLVLGAVTCNRTDRT